MFKEVSVLLDYDGYICKAYYAAIGRGEDIEKAQEILERLEEASYSKAYDFFRAKYPECEICIEPHLYISKHTKKKDLFPIYKCHRKSNPEFKEFRDMVIATDDRLEFKEGYEADDFIVYKERIDRENTLCFSDDKDIKYYVINYCKINIDEQPITQNETEIKNEAIAQLLAGDSEDNVKGVPKVGMKTAHKLLNNEYTLENVVNIYKDKGCSALHCARDMFLLIPVNPELETVEKELESMTKFVQHIWSKK